MLSQSLVVRKYRLFLMSLALLLSQSKVVWKYRHFLMSLVSLDVKKRYRRTALGVGWSLFTPLMMTVVYCFVFGSLFNNMDWKKQGPYFLAGTSLFNFVRDSVMAGCHTFFRNEQYIRQCPLPLTIYTLRTVLGEGIHFLVSQAIVLVFVCLLIPGAFMHLLCNLWFIVPSVLLLFVFCWSISIVASFVSAFFLDSQNLSEVTFQLLFFLTPIVYPTDMIVKEGLISILRYNPIVTFLEIIRTPVLDGTVPDLWAFEKAVIVVMLFGSFAMVLLARLEKRLIFRL